MIVNAGKTRERGRKKKGSFCHCVIIFLYATKEKNKSQELKKTILEYFCLVIDAKWTLSALIKSNF